MKPELVAPVALATVYYNQGQVHEVHGNIRNKYTFALGGVSGPLGYPLTDESGTADGRGRFNNFQGGSIYWTAQTGANEIGGAIRDKWVSLGSEKSYLGYPTADEKDCNGGRCNTFQYGGIRLTSGGSAQDLPETFTVESDITFSDGTPVGGHAKLVLFSNGQEEFVGDLHDSGAPSYEFSLDFWVNGSDGQRYPSAHESQRADRHQAGCRHRITRLPISARHQRARHRRVWRQPGLQLWLSYELWQ